MEIFHNNSVVNKLQFISPSSKGGGNDFGPLGEKMKKLEKSKFLSIFGKNLCKNYLINFNYIFYPKKRHHNDNKYAFRLI